MRKEAVEQLIEPIAPTALADATIAAIKGRPTFSDDPLWTIIGIGESHGPTDVAENKQRYLADVYAAERQ